jgi:DNA-directed RNA polymerase subunit E'/Rpb7
MEMFPTTMLLKTCDAFANTNIKLNNHNSKHKEEGVKDQVRTRRKVRMKVIGTRLPNQQEHEVDSLWPLGLMNEKINTRQKLVVPTFTIQFLGK